MRVAGIFVNYRTAEMTVRAVGVLLDELASVGTSHTYIVDNDSGDGSVEHIAQAIAVSGWQDRVTLIAAPRNGGYGYGINVAVREALSRPDRPEYFYVINTDAFPDPGSVGKLLEFMDQHPTVGMTGSRVHGPDGDTQGAAFRFPSVWSELEGTACVGLLSKLLSQHIMPMPPPPDHQDVDWLPGTSMMIRRPVFEGGVYFDEDFFLYFEEVDFALRVRNAGWRNYFVADAPITHIGSVSTGFADESRRMPQYWFDSRHRYFLKHHGIGYTAVCDAAWAIGYAAFLTKRAALGRPAVVRTHLLRDFVRASVRRLRTARAREGKSNGAAEDDPKTTPVDSDSSPVRAVPPPAPGAAPAAGFKLREVLAEDFATYNRDLLQPGFWAVVAHRLGTRAACARRPAVGATLGAASGVLSTAVDWVWGIHIPRTVALGRRVRLWDSGGMLLGARAIGNDVHIHHDTTFGPLRAGDMGPEALPVIGDRAEIGSGVSILGAVNVGHDAVVQVNSLVLRHVPPGATVLGVPARVVPG